MGDLSPLDTDEIFKIKNEKDIYATQRYTQIRSH